MISKGKRNFVLDLLSIILAFIVFIWLGYSISSVFVFEKTSTQEEHILNTIFNKSSN
jgi:hypothetical protein